MSSRAVYCVIVAALMVASAGPTIADEVYIPEVGTGTGLALYNPGSKPVPVGLAMLDLGDTVAPFAHVELIVAPGETWRSDSVGTRLFGGATSRVTLRVKVDGRLIVTAWRYLDEPGSPKDRVPLAPWPAQLAAMPGVPLQLVVSGEPVEPIGDASVSMLELAGEPTTLELTSFDEDGAPLATLTEELAANERRTVALADLAGWRERPARITASVWSGGRVLVLGRALAAAIGTSEPSAADVFTREHELSLDGDQRNDDEVNARRAEISDGQRGTAGDVDGDGDVDSADVACVTATIYDPTYGCAVATGAGDITAVYAGRGLEGGGASGEVTLGIDLPLILDTSIAGGGPVINAENSNGTGLYGKSTTASGIGVVGIASSTTEGASKGVAGSAYARRSSGVFGQCLADLNCNGVRGEASQGGYGVTGLSVDGCGVAGNSQTSYGVYGTGVTGVRGRGDKGVWGDSTVNSGVGVLGEATASAGVGIKGVGGTGQYAHGVLAECADGAALAASSTNGMAIDALGGGAGESFPVARLTSTNSAGVGLMVTVDSSEKALILDNQDPNGTIVTFRNNGSSRFYTKCNGETHMTGYGNGLYDATLQVTNTSSAGIAISAANDSSDSTLVVANDGTGDLMRAFASGNLRFRVKNNGDVAADGSITGGGADYAELVPVHQPGLEPGDVVALAADGRLMRTTTPEQASVVGVVSTEPGFLSDLYTGVPTDQKVPLAVVGIVPVKVTADGGPIRPGDMLTPSAAPGTAMRAHQPRIGSIIGKAMEPLESGDGLILVLISAR